MTQDEFLDLATRLFREETDCSAPLLRVGEYLS